MRNRHLTILRKPQNPCLPQFPVTDTSTASTARATSTGCRFVSKYKTSTDTAEILRSSPAFEVSSKDATLPGCRTQPLSFASQLEPYISDFHGAELVPELRESLRFPRAAGSDTNVIIQRLKPLLSKDFLAQECKPMTNDLSRSFSSRRLNPTGIPTRIFNKLKAIGFKIANYRFSYSF